MVIEHPTLAYDIFDSCAVSKCSLQCNLSSVYRRCTKGRLGTSSSLLCNFPYKPIKYNVVIFHSSGLPNRTARSKQHIKDHILQYDISATKTYFHSFVLEFFSLVGSVIFVKSVTAAWNLYPSEGKVSTYGVWLCITGLWPTKLHNDTTFLHTVRNNVIWAQY